TNHYRWSSSVPCSGPLHREAIFQKELCQTIGSCPGLASAAWYFDQLDRSVQYTLTQHRRADFGLHGIYHVADDTPRAKQTPRISVGIRGRAIGILPPQCKFTTGAS